jgi:plastocyanin
MILQFLVIAISGCTGPDPEQATVVVTPAPIPVQTTEKAFQVPEPLTVYINIKGSMFTPLELEITNGTTVKWTNLDSVEYAVNVSGSQSPPLKKKDTWSFTFNKTGTYEFRCDLHPSMPHGRITVVS